MSDEHASELTRRAFVGTGLALPALGLGALGAIVLLEPTPACGDDDDDKDAKPTASDIEGPYFKPKSPERASLLEADTKGTKLVLAGRVVTTRKQPVAHALLDFWQANDAGEYDNETFRLRGHLFTDEDGRYRLETIYPGLYPGRTRHIHVKVQAPKQPILTTQLYFPNEPRNAKDGLYKPALLVDIKDVKGEADKDEKRARFQFVLAMS